ncbi:MAG: hypothetical protein RL885_13580 [Planctomycetota bacterium]
MRAVLLLLPFWIALLGPGSSQDDWERHLADLDDPEYEVRLRASRWFERSPKITEARLEALFEHALQGSLEQQRHVVEIIAHHPLALRPILSWLDSEERSARRLARWIADRVFERADPEASVWPIRFRDARLERELPEVVTPRSLVDALQGCGGSLVPVLEPTLGSAVRDQSIPLRYSTQWRSPIDGMLEQTLEPVGLEGIECEPFYVVGGKLHHQEGKGKRVFLDLLRGLKADDAGLRRSVAWDLGALGWPVLTELFSELLESDSPEERQVGAYGLAGSGRAPTPPRLGDAEIIRSLVQRTGQDDRLRAGLVSLLAHADSRMVRGALFEGWAEATRSERVGRMQVLRHHVRPEDRSFLLEHLRRANADPELTREVLAAWTEVDRPLDGPEVDVVARFLDRDGPIGDAAANLLAAGVTEGGFIAIRSRLDSERDSVRLRAARALEGVAVMDLPEAMDAAAQQLARETSPDICLALGRSIGGHFELSDPETQRRVLRHCSVLLSLADPAAMIRLYALALHVPSRVFDQEIVPALRSKLQAGETGDPARWVAGMLLAERWGDKSGGDRRGRLRTSENRELLSTLRRAFESAEEPLMSWAAHALAVWKSEYAVKSFSNALESGIQRGESAWIEAGRVGWQILAETMVADGAEDRLALLINRLERSALDAPGPQGMLFGEVHSEVVRIAWEKLAHQRQPSQRN